MDIDVNAIIMCSSLTHVNSSKREITHVALHTTTLPTFPIVQQFADLFTNMHFTLEPPKTLRPTCFLYKSFPTLPGCLSFSFVWYLNVKWKQLTKMNVVIVYIPQAWPKAIFGFIYVIDDSLKGLAFVYQPFCT